MQKGISTMLCTDKRTQGQTHAHTYTDKQPNYGNAACVFLDLEEISCQGVDESM
jgi:hypothetical protein